MREISKKGCLAYREACRERAKDFSEETFIKLIKDEIAEVIDVA